LPVIKENTVTENKGRFEENPKQFTRSVTFPVKKQEFERRVPDMMTVGRVWRGVLLAMKGIDEPHQSPHY